MFAPLRPAFWALCLGLMLPLGVFVVAELGFGPSMPAAGARAAGTGRPTGLRAVATRRPTTSRDASHPDTPRRVSYTTERDLPLLDEASPLPHVTADHAAPEQPPEPVGEPARSVELRPIETEDEATVAEELWRDQDRLHSELTRLRQDVHGLFRGQERQQIEQLHQATELLQQMQQSSKLQDLELKIRDLEQDRREPGSRDARPQPATPETDEPGETTSSVVRPHDGSADRYDVLVTRSPVGPVLGQLAKLAGRSLVVDSRARGTITARLENVTFEEAIQSLTRAGQLAVESDGRTLTFTAAGDARPVATAPRVEARVLRLRHLDPDEFRRLIEPLLTPQLGRVSRGAAPDAVEGGHFDGRGTVVVTDVPETLTRIEHMLRELDLPPRQVAIEARVLSVKLTDETRFGVNFAILGATDGPSGLPEDDPLIVQAGHSTDVGCSPALSREGLRQATVQTSIPQIINVLERIGDTSVIASPRLVTLNNRAAELGIGERTGYRTLVSSGNGLAPLDFVETGTRLRIRPVITGDGFVRLDVQPKRSTQRPVKGNAPPSVQFADLSTHVLLRDGETAILGGIIEEQVRENTTRVPVLGSLPVVGSTFRSKSEQTERSELIVLLTARVVEEGVATTDLDEAAGSVERRHLLMRDMQSNTGRRNAARRLFEKARNSFTAGRVLEARHFARDALQLDKTNPQIVELHDQIERAARHHSQPVVPASHVIPVETPWEPSFAPPQLPTYAPPTTRSGAIPEHLPPVEYSVSPTIDRRVVDPSVEVGTPATPGASRGPILPAPGTGSGTVEYPGRATHSSTPAKARREASPRAPVTNTEDNPPPERAAAALGPALPPPAGR
jgi:type IV pilus assembly protein PilQ